MGKSKKKHRILFRIAGPFLAFAACFGWLSGSIPDHFLVNEGEKLSGLIHMPFIQEEVLEAGSQPTSNIPQGKVKLQCSILGVIPIKNVDVTVVPKERVYPGGSPVGIYMKTKGILVVGTGEVKGADGLSYDPAENILKSGDYIIAANGSGITRKEELIYEINNSDGNPVVLKIERGGSLTELKISPVKTEEGAYKLGLWVRDDTQGIGTLTYMDAKGNYGALGHGISDVDTGMLLNLNGGTLYHTDILSVVRGMQGSPGEMTGVIRYQSSEILGTIDANTDRGIFGKITRNQEQFQAKETVEVAYKQDVRVGPATILSAVDGEVREYAICIDKINLNSAEPNKSMVISVTDPELLEKTGGIIQGMSGSPIIQNGCLVGAVTHVFVQNSTKGYGIFIENMLGAVNDKG